MSGNSFPITLQGLGRGIIHVDCDAFFASVEQSLNPELKGKPVVTGKERGIAAAMSYEAKRRGVVRGMRLFEVKKVCPDAVILPTDYETYSLVSKRFYSILRRFTPEVEEYSIDEVFASLSGLRRVYRTSYEEIALKIKEAVEGELGITVSMGLSLTKSLAKIGSKENKPSGFTRLYGYELHHFLKRIPTERVCGFGPSSVALLAKNGIFTVFDYVMHPEVFAKKLLGKIGAELWHELRGTPVYAIQAEAKNDPASISKTKTFTPPSDERDFVKGQLIRNVESAFIKLRRHQLKAGSISIYLTDSEYKSAGLCADLNRATGSTLEILGLVSELFATVYRSRVKYRRTGVCLNHLEADSQEQPDLFQDHIKIQAMKDISRAIDEVNAIYGKHTLHVASSHCVTKFGQHLGDRGDVTRRRVDILKGETVRQHLRIPVWNIFTENAKDSL